MVYRFVLVSDEADKFKREIEINSDATFLDLRNAVLDSVDFSKDDMNSFFLCDDSWEKHGEITLVDMGSASDEDIWIMDETPLDSLIEDEGQRLIFVFDYLTERSFFMELKAIVTGKSLTFPVCTVKKGNPPVQRMDIEEFDTQLEKKAAAAAQDMDLDIFDETGFNPEELEQGFDQYDMND